MKVYKSIDEQIEILVGRNMHFRSKKFAKRILEYENYYYVINGYKQLFIDGTQPEKYKHDVAFNEIVALYTFDRKLRELLLPELLRIEHCIKAKIIDVFSSRHGHNHVGYLQPESFNCTGIQNLRRTNMLIAELFRLIDKQSRRHDAVAHYVDHHGYVPLWVLSKVMTFGKINSFYACMTLTEKQIVANAFGLKAETFKSVIDFVAVFRNKCAHGERVYCHSKEGHLPHPLSNLPLHEALDIQRNAKGYKYGKQDVLALLIAMKYLMQPNRYSKLIKRIHYALDKKLAHRLHSISISDVSEVMGLCDNWKELQYIELRYG